MILVEKGESPLILCLPHSGTQIPPAIENRMNATGRLQTDISWRLETILDLDSGLDATLLRSTASRYVIDVDQAPDLQQDPEADPVNALCPVTTLDNKRIYQLDEEPGPTETEQRALLFYFPFHEALRQEVERLKKIHDTVVLIDCRSVRSKIKGYIDQELAVLNLGTADHAACHPDLVRTFAATFEGAEGMSVAVDDVFQGGYITRTYGRPDIGVHAMTLVIAQRAYLRHESPPFEPDRTSSARLKTLLGQGLSRVSEWAQGFEPDPAEQRSAGEPAVS
ncbi:N-formylglutamate amidohydrolase [Roseibium aggregatum]|uniref:Formiminoglutamase n=1 Tax=Roseibium aggregatum TaxID=187304 RepID=A0A926P5G6_9HYPH|nr:N-formylglutamate amidohydrolase [Roseibium aggregatum]MBD1548321.1 formiminoglutamase [Roseibium aggregatum]